MQFVNEKIKKHVENELIGKLGFGEKEEVVTYFMATTIPRTLTVIIFLMFLIPLMFIGGIILALLVYALLFGIASLLTGKKRNIMPSQRQVLLFTNQRLVIFKSTTMGKFPHDFHDAYPLSDIRFTSFTKPLWLKKKFSKMKISLQSGEHFRHRVPLKGNLSMSDEAKSFIDNLGMKDIEI